MLKYAIVYYSSRYFFSCLLFDWYWRNKKSRNSSSLIMKEKNDKKGSWCSWLFQTFKTIKVAVAHSATEFPCAFSYE